MTSLNVQPEQLDRFRSVKALLTRLTRYGGTAKTAPTGMLDDLVDPSELTPAVFFQDDRRFDFIVSTVHERVDHDQWDLQGRAVRIWCPTPAGGYETWSLAIVLNELIHTFTGLGGQILVTDPREEALIAAQRAIYPRETLSNVPPVLQSRYFTAVHRRPQYRQIAPQLRALTTFRQLDPIVDELAGEFDFIVCRNMFTDLDRTARQRLADRLTRALADGGAMIVNSTEALAGVRHNLRYVQPGIYRNPYTRN